MRRRTIWIRNAPEIPMWIFQEENANPKLRREEAAEDLWIEDNTDLQRRDFVLTESLPHTKHCPRHMGHMSLNLSNNPMMKFGLTEVTQTHVFS